MFAGIDQQPQKTKIVPALSCTSFEIRVPVAAFFGPYSGWKKELARKGPTIPVLILVWCWPNQQLVFTKHATFSFI
jgi:hypothetical protein